jgi:hypothetical protein
LVVRVIARRRTDTAIPFRLTRNASKSQHRSSGRFQPHLTR